jgi:hypothetical protein
MIAARRTTRFIAALALAGVMLGSSPLAPTSLAASPQPTSSRLSRALFCDYLARAIALLEAQPQTPLRDFLLAQLRRLQASYCG